MYKYRKNPHTIFLQYILFIKIFDFICMIVCINLNIVIHMSLVSIVTPNRFISQWLYFIMPQIKLWEETYQEFIRRNFISQKIIEILIQYFYMFIMSQRPTNSSSSKRFKEKFLTVENDSDVKIFLTQKYSSSSDQVISNQC